MKASVVFLLVVGCMWAFFVAWLFIAIAGIADSQGAIFATVLYWGGMLVGSLALIIGSAILLRGASSRYGAVLVVIGCMIFTGFSLYNSITGMQRKPLQAPPIYSFYIVLLVLMLLTNAAGYRVVKYAISSPAAVR